MNAPVGLFVLSLLVQGQSASHQGDAPSNAAGGELRVKLEDASGRTPEDVAFTLTRLNDGIEAAWPFADRQENDRFIFSGLIAGRYSLEAKNDQSFYAVGYVDVVGNEAVPLTLSLVPRQPCHVAGRITNGSEPVFDALVWAQLHAWPQPLWRAARTDSDGSFDLDLPQAGDWLFEVRHPECDPGERGWGLPLAYDFARSIPVAGEKQFLEFVLPTGSISGSLRGPNGEPVAGQEVRLDSESLRAGWSLEVSDALGHFEFRGLPAGTHRLESGGPDVFGERRGKQNYAFNGRALTLDSGAASLTGVEFDLVRGGELDCQFTVLHGRGPSWTWVYAHPTSAPVGSWFLLGQTGEDGRLHAAGQPFITGLPAGPLDISLRAQGERSLATSPDASVAITPETRVEASLRLQPATILVIQAHDDSEIPVFVRLALVRDASGREHFINGPEGEFRPMIRTAPLAPGKYTIGVADPSGRTIEKEVVLEGLPVQEVSFTF